jgi:hypothetical protein
MEPDVSTGSPDEGEAPNNALLIEDEGGDVSRETSDHDDLNGASESEERFARKNGWVEKDKWRGDPDEWVDAKNFADRGRGVNAIMRRNNERLERELEETKREAREIRRMLEDRERREQNMSITQLETQRDQAVEQGDVATYKRLDKAISDERAARPAPRVQGPDPTLVKVAQDWQAENAWYSTDDAKTAVFDKASTYVFKERPDLRGSIEFLRETERRARRMAPQLFDEAPVADRPTPTNRTASGRPAPTQNRRAAGKTWDDMPKAAQDMGEQFIRKGRVASKEDYAKTYFAEND